MVEEKQMRVVLLKNMPVVSMADGAKVGTVQDVLFDTAQYRVAALVLASAGGQILLPFNAIKSIGNDAVTVDSLAATQGVGTSLTRDGLRGLNDMTSLKVVNSDGSLLGDVKDIEIERADGKLTEVAVRKGGVFGMGGTVLTMPVASIRSIGPKLMTVDVSVNAPEA